MQRGRGREFYQLNVDIFGIEGLDADFEIINVADTVMQSFKAKRDMYTIRLNSRKLMNYVMFTALELNNTQAALMGKLIDRRAKMDASEFAGQVDAIFSPSQREAGAADQLFAFLGLTSLDDLSDELAGQESVANIRKLLDRFAKSGITNVVFDPSLMRGFDYYTDIVFEVFDTDPANNRSMFGGGRYDGMLEIFGAEPVPTVGFGMGDITLMNFLETHQLLPILPPLTDVYLVLIGDVTEGANTVAAGLRKMGARVEVDYSGRKPDKQIKTAAKKGIRYVMFIGDKELATQQFTIKDLATSQEETHGLERIVSTVKDIRKR
jgi:histidyl-tRNA synthetase